MKDSILKSLVKRFPYGLGLFFVTCAAGGTVQLEDEFAAAVLLDRVQVLTAPALAGRASGTPEGDAAADTVAAWFDEAALEPAFAAGWFQSFPLAGDALTGKSARNVGGVLAGAGRLKER